MKIGYHCEGGDRPILHCLVCRLLNVPEDRVESCAFAQRPQGYDKVVRDAPLALRVLYLQHWALAAVVAVDNDGHEDLRHTGQQQDPTHPRHWVHPRKPERHPPDCRFCRLHCLARGTINALPETRGFVAPEAWPVVICVPTEELESWLLIARGLTDPKHQALLDAENRPAGVQMKVDFYGSKRALLSRVKSRALPLLRDLADVTQIGRHSRSFRLFARQVLHLRRRMEAAALTLGEVL
jgi:hypothetical protein